MIKGEKVSLVYKKNRRSFWGLNQVSFELPRGRITTFLGKSGAGKTSLISCVAQLQQRYDGLISYDESDMRLLKSRERASRIGFVFQQFNLFSNLTVLENCMQPLRVVLQFSAEKAEERAVETLALVGMQEAGGTYPRYLSVGQQQRVAIARALSFKPSVLLFDEPTSALDPENAAVIARIIRQMAQRGIAIGLTSHDMSFVRAVLDRAYFMQDGSIVESIDVQQCKIFDTAPLLNSFLTGTRM
ncbi:amino acid ABC transporter ATP-binding protein [Candidatus Dependentiae bacterium HGW-Dependentiae-1]|nr:MAG: amino acid ABC transporter ATP-binding protein [Candidatus Dependentiae bacterium HGW-Dependentiae-1]